MLSKVILKLLFTLWRLTNKMEISALFVSTNSVYKLLDIDSWDIDRDAMRFTGSNKVIAHPPCRLWGRLYKFSKAPESEKETALFAVDVIRRNGGILEHPKDSRLWSHCGLPAPGQVCDAWGGYSIEVDQSWWDIKHGKGRFYI